MAHPVNDVSARLSPHGDRDLVPREALPKFLGEHKVLTGPAFGIRPIVVVLADRTDLDDQLYGTFEASELLPSGQSRP